MPQGFDKWLGDLFRRRHQELVRYAARLVGGRDSGEEVVQNTYLRLARHSAQVMSTEHPKAYAFAVARRSAFDFAAQRHREWLHRVDFDDEAVADAGSDPTLLLARRERVVKLAVVINELPSACQKTFVMNKIEGYSHREIAGKLGISTSMVEKHIMRAMMHFRDRMREEDLS